MPLLSTMEVKIKNKIIDIEPNSKPYFLKHVLALLVDTAILFFAFFGLFNLFMITPLANTYNTYKSQVVQIQDVFLVETGYGYKDYTAKFEDYPTYPVYEDEFGKYIVLINPEATNEQKSAYQTALNNSQEYKDNIFGANLHSYLICLLSGGIAEIVFILAVPLIDKKRRTLGKLLVGISLYSTKNQEYAYWYHVLLRFLITFVETALPFMMLNMYTFLVVPLAEILFAVINRENRALRDVCTFTKLIEGKSYLPIDVLEEDVKPE